MKTLMAILIAISLTNLMGCSLEASLQNMGSEAVIQKKAPLKNFVAGSTPRNQTSRGYYVEASTGNFIDQKKASTTGGYKVYISLQSNVISN